MNQAQRALSLAWDAVVHFPPEILLPLLGVGLVVGVASGLYYRRKIRRTGHL